MASNKVTYQGEANDVIYKSDITTILPDTKIYSQKDCIILFMKDGSLMGAFNDEHPYNIVNEDTGGMKTFLGSKRGVEGCAIYYINKKKHIQVKWGTPHRIDVYDKGFKINTTVGAHGSYRFTIVNPLKLFTKMKLSDDGSVTKEMVNKFFSEEVSKYLRQAMTKAFSKNETGLRDIAEITAQETKMADNIKRMLKPVFYYYGVELVDFSITKIHYDEEFLAKIRGIRQEAVFNEYSEENELVEEIKEEAHSVCQVCGHKNKEGAKFCTNCGSKIKTHISCKSCGEELPLDAKFCFNCGEKVGDE